MVGRLNSTPNKIKFDPSRRTFKYKYSLIFRLTLFRETTHFGGERAAGLFSYFQQVTVYVMINRLFTKWLNILNNGLSLTCINQTFIALISKIKNPKPTPGLLLQLGWRATSSYFARLRHEAAGKVVNFVLYFCRQTRVNNIFRLVWAINYKTSRI